MAYPLFCMGKGRLETIDSFRKSGNGVLLASDSAGEGIDLPGDILSSLVVVRLPFPTPDPVSEYERTLHDDFYSYLSERIVPDMLIKLRQWIGRGIRRETDTCVFSILDSRAAGRYKMTYWPPCLICRSQTGLMMWGGFFCPIRTRATLTPKRVEGTASGSSRSIGQDNISYRCKNEKEGCQWANLIYLRWILRRYGKWMCGRLTRTPLWI